MVIITGKLAVVIVRSPAIDCVRLYKMYVGRIRGLDGCVFPKS